METQEPATEFFLILDNYTSNSGMKNTIRFVLARRFRYQKEFYLAKIILKLNRSWTLSAATPWLMLSYT